MQLVELSTKKFDKFSQKFGNFSQSLEMHQRYLKNHQETYLLGLKDGHKIVAAALVVSKRQIFGQKIFNIPRGFIMDWNAENRDEVISVMTQNLKEFLKSKNGMVIEISPDVKHVAETDSDGVPRKKEYFKDLKTTFKQLKYKDLGEYEFVKWVYTLDPCERTPEELLKSFRYDHRTNIRFATERYGMKIRQLKPDELDIIKKLSHEAAERHGFVDPDLSYYQEMQAAFGKKVIFLVAEVPQVIIDAFNDGTKGAALKEVVKNLKSNGKMIPTAAAMFIESGDEIIYLFSGASDKYKRFNGSYFLQWYIIQQAHKEHKTYNFYGVNPSKDNGVYDFKRGFHGELEEYIGTFMLPLTFLGKIFVHKQAYSYIGEVH